MNDTNTISVYLRHIDADEGHNLGSFTPDFIDKLVAVIREYQVFVQNEDFAMLCRFLDAQFLYNLDNNDFYFEIVVENNE